MQKRNAKNGMKRHVGTWKDVIFLKIIFLKNFLFNKIRRPGRKIKIQKIIFFKNFFHSIKYAGLA